MTIWQTYFRTVAVILAVEIALSITVTAVNTQPHSTLILRCQGYIVARIQNTNPSWRFYSSLSLFLLAVTFLCYLTLALVLKINRKGKKETKYTILTAKVAVVKSVLFGVCFLFPYFPLLVDIPVPLRHSRNLVSLFSAVMFLHGGLNPLVYIWTSKIFREAFRRTLPKWVRKHLASQITGPNQVTSAVFTVPTTRNSLRERSSWAALWSTVMWYNWSTSASLMPNIRHYLVRIAIIHHLCARTCTKLSNA